MRRLSFAPLASTLVLATALTGCIPATTPPQAPPPVQQAPRPAPPAPRPVLGSDWRDWPLTPGTWTYRQDARGSLALYGQASADALVTLRCDRAARRLYLSRSGAVATPLTIRTSSTTRALVVQPTGGTPPYVAVALASTDPLLDAVAFSRGRFTMEQAGRPPLVVPPYAEVGRVIEDCRG